VNDGEVLKNTISDLVSWGANAVILMRFANKVENGLIFGNEPLIEDITVQTVEEFGTLVKEMHELFGNSVRISGTPVYDPITNTPFAIYYEEEILNELRAKIKAEATIITGNVSYIYLSKIFENTPIKVISVNKDIADLITKTDLETVDLSQVTDTVLYPVNALVHERDAEDIFTKDGMKRIVLRGIDKLTMDGEVSGIFTKEEAIDFEITAFNELIEKINFFGNPV
jgi:methanogenesis marker radical SAM protein